MHRPVPTDEPAGLVAVVPDVLSRNWHPEAKKYARGSSTRMIHAEIAAEQQQHLSILQELLQKSARQGIIPLLGTMGLDKHRLLRLYTLVLGWIQRFT